MEALLIEYKKMIVDYITKDEKKVITIFYVASLLR